MAEKEKILMRPGAALQYQALPNTLLPTKSFRSANAWIKMAGEANKIAQTAGEVFRVRQQQKNKDAKEAGVLAQIQGEVIDNIDLPENKYERDHYITGYQLSAGSYHTSIYESERRRDAAIFAQDPENTDADYTAFEAEKRREYIQNNLKHPTAILSFTQGLNRSPNQHQNIWTHGSRTAQSRQTVENTANRAVQTFHNAVFSLGQVNENQQQLDSFGEPVVGDDGKPVPASFLSIEATQIDFENASEQYFLAPQAHLARNSKVAARILQDQVKLLQTPDEKRASINQIIMNKEVLEHSQVTDALTRRHRGDYEEQHKELVFYYDLLLALKRPSKDGKGEIPLLNSEQRNYFLKQKETLVVNHKSNLEVMDLTSQKNAAENVTRWGIGRVMRTALRHFTDINTPEIGAEVSEYWQMQSWADGKVETGEVDADGVPIKEARVVALGAMSEADYQDKTHLRLFLKLLWDEKYRQEKLASDFRSLRTAQEKVFKTEQDLKEIKDIRRKLYSIRDEKDYDALFKMLGESSLDPADSRALSLEIFKAKDAKGLDHHGKMMEQGVAQMRSNFKVAARKRMEGEQEAAWYAKLQSGTLQRMSENFFNLEANAHLPRVLTAEIVTAMFELEGAEKKWLWKPVAISPAELQMYMDTRVDTGALNRATYQGVASYINAAFREKFPDKKKYPQIDPEDPDIRKWIQTFQLVFSAGDALSHVTVLKDAGWVEGGDFPPDLFMKAAKPPHLAATVPSTAPSLIPPPSKPAVEQPEKEPIVGKGETKEGETPEVALQQEDEPAGPEQFASYTFERRSAELLKEVEHWEGAWKEAINEVRASTTQYMEAERDHSINQLHHLMTTAKRNLEALKMLEGEQGVDEANNGYNNAYNTMLIAYQKEMVDKGAVNDPTHPFHITFTEMGKKLSKGKGSGLVHMDVITTTQMTYHAALFGFSVSWKQDDQGVWQPISPTPEESKAEIWEQYNLWVGGQAKEGNVFKDISQLKDFGRGKMLHPITKILMTPIQEMELIRDQQLEFTDVPKLSPTPLIGEGKVYDPRNSTFGNFSDPDGGVRPPVAKSTTRRNRSTVSHDEYIDVVREGRMKALISTENLAAGTAPSEDYRRKPRGFWASLFSHGALPLPKQDWQYIIDSLSSARGELAASKAGEYNQATFVPLFFMNPRIGYNMDNDQYLDLVGSVRPHMKQYVFKNPKETDPKLLRPRLPSEIREDLGELIRAEIAYQEKHKDSGVSYLLGPDVMSALKEMSLLEYKDEPEIPEEVPEKIEDPMLEVMENAYLSASLGELDRKFAGEQKWQGDYQKEITKNVKMRRQQTPRPPSRSWSGR